MSTRRVDIDNTFGACFVAAQISLILYGITTLQSYFYFVTYPDDSMKNKALVSFVWLLDTTHTAFVSILLYHYLVTNYDNPPSLAIGHWSLFMSLAINVILSCVVKSFFANQIFLLARLNVRWWLTSMIAISIVANFSFGTETVVRIIQKKKLAELSKGTLSASASFAGFSILADVLIAGSLCILLYKSRTGQRKSNTIINTLIVYAINRCLLTSVLSVVEAIVFPVFPNSLWSFAIDFVLGNLYANSLLAALNSRQSMRAAITSVQFSDIAFVQSTELRNNCPLRTDTAVLIEQNRLWSQGAGHATTV